VFRRLILLSLLLTLAACDQTPTGRYQLSLVPESMLNDMGRQTFAQMRASQPVVDGTPADARVQCIAREIIAAARRVYPDAAAPDAWQVAVFDNPTPNAFALPGGYIGVHTGMLEIADNADQLAAVIGHEVAHLLADHGNERLTQQLGIKAVLLLIGLFSDIDNEQLLQALGLGARLGITLPFSRRHESEADIMGLNLMAAAGFEPRQSVGLWRNMAAAGGGQPLEFLSTHPAHDTRIENLHAQMAPALERFEQAEPADCAG